MPVRKPSDLDGFFDSYSDIRAERLLMLHAYFDESGHESSGWVCVAGWMGTEEQWRMFVPLWNDALGQRKSLHTKELRFKKDREKRLLERLAPIPASCGLQMVIGGTNVGDYQHLLGGLPKEQLLTGFAACVARLVIRILEAVPDGERIELVFEEQHQYSESILYVMDWMWGKGAERRPLVRGKLAKWGFVQKGVTVMTDPADLLAFAWRESKAFPNSVKAQWCQPFLTSGEPISNIMTGARARKEVAAWVRRIRSDQYPIGFLNMDTPIPSVTHDLATETAYVAPFAADDGSFLGVYSRTVRVESVVSP